MKTKFSFSSAEAVMLESRSEAERQREHSFIDCRKNLMRADQFQAKPWRNTAGYSANMLTAKDAKAGLADQKLGWMALGSVQSAA